MQQKSIVTFNEFGNYGRLGNQLFQAAAVYGYARYYNGHIPYLINNDIVKYFPNLKNHFLLGDEKIRCNAKFFETHFTYDPLPAHMGNVNLHGYFQSEKYFKHCKDDIVDMFKSKVKKEVDKKYLGVHVRRGDYVNLKDVYCDLYSIGYYDFIDDIKKDYDEILIFSDDKEFIKSKFPQYSIMDGYQDYEEFRLLCNCDDIVMANSSFSWWAAYLNPNLNKKVYAPKKWFTNGTDVSDLYCDWMIKL